MTEITDRPQPAPEAGATRTSALVDPSGPARPLPAGKVLAVMLIAFGLAGLFNSKRFVHAAETMPLGWQRTTLLHIARPVDSLAHFLHTDVPRDRVDHALGRTTPSNGGAFEPPAGVLPTVTPSPRGSASASAAPPVTHFRDVSPTAPLKLLVTGDSMIEFMAPKLIEHGEESHALDASSEVKYGTGLVRDDVLNWPAYAHQQMVKYRPEAVVVMMGGNDGQGMTLPGGKILHEGSPEWAAEYRRRATIMMQVFTEGGQRHLYWVGMPIAKSARLAGLYRQIDDGLRAAASAVPGATYVDIWDDFAPGGHYADFVDGQLVRARDGIHLNREGSARLMRKVYALLDEDWKLSS
jgi:lysophospholipase L1-like esterase